MSKAPPPLYDHQTASIKAFDASSIGFDMSDPGTGKTRVQIELFANRRKRGGGRALIVCPKSLMRSAWEEDFKKYAPHIHIVTCPALKREEAFATYADVHVTNTDAVTWLAKKPPSFFKDYDTLIVDESSAFKHATSQRSKALKKISKFFKNRYLLSGTPAANAITDIWHQAFILDEGKRLGKSFFQFRASVCEPKQVGPSPNMLKWTQRAGAEQAVSMLLADITVRHKFEECLDIPPNHTFTVPYQMSSKQADAYKQMEKYAVSVLDGDRTITAINAAVVMGKLLQIASGAAYSDQGSGNNPLLIKASDALGYNPIEEARYELVADLVDQRKHSLIFFNWTHQRDMIIKYLKKRGITYCIIDGTTSDKVRDENVRYFQGGLYRVMLAHPASAAHGLTLTRATTTIWASPPLNLEHYLQGNRRIYRSGQTQSTETIMILADHTIEAHVYDQLQKKNMSQSTMLDMLQEHFREAS